VAVTFIDARLPIRFGAMCERRPGEAVLSDAADAPAPFARLTGAGGGHPVDCACCIQRSGAALALAALFRERAVGAGPAFGSVLAVVGPDAEGAIRAALADDPLVSARFRLG
jgi:hypothetical protein